ncbi:cold-shock protein [Mycoplasma putrefaciens]|uniref:Cold shock protein n=1 Tax=Mycoplasma putrefaciens (strain ATCC 15718 / NCTC 10155 / C30 KS-1 / KS-1) TaxID=743965 RepID=A0A7U3ZS61_MYCPK|nr:cold shock domain-containing protein [Mycoplasma putrefaciens]AEM68531.1 cold shock protein [Mycoplasma putrefaciens KS1]
MNTGIVKWFSKEKGFGFIISDSDKSNVFVHYKNININDLNYFDSGEKVTFVLAENKKGFEALNVSIK